MSRGVARERSGLTRPGSKGGGGVVERRKTVVVTGRWVCELGRRCEDEG